jgi:hypothetical protein
MACHYAADIICHKKILKDDVDTQIPLRYVTGILGFDNLKPQLVAECLF